MKIEFDLEKIKHYDTAGPRYTSYPTAVAFGPSFTEVEYRKHAELSNSLQQKSQRKTPLSLYFHIPFCDTVCFYCACNKIATKDYSKADTYLEYLYREIDMQAKLFDSDRLVEQLHWGGGTPTFLNHQQIRDLMSYTRKSFALVDVSDNKEDEQGEYSIEIDPRSVSEETIKVLREVGFNRFSLGVQDINDEVQKAVNRIQPFSQTQAIIEACRKNHAKSISVDLIYGLPLQTVDSFAETLESIIKISPDRISLFNYAHMPHLFKPQRRINEAQLPKAEDKLKILQYSIKTLVEAGYNYIGMDHFAKPKDELSLAQAQGQLHRNFQGYTTHAECDLVAMGVSAISNIYNSYSQNEKELEKYYQRIDQNELPIIRGLIMNDDDCVRHAVIQQLSCHFLLNFKQIEEQFDIKFDQYFESELTELIRFEEDDLLLKESDRIEVTPRGRLLIRNICMIFDVYLKEQINQQRFSKVI